jgi:hypothetical protein
MAAPEHEEPKQETNGGGHGCGKEHFFGRAQFGGCRNFDRRPRAADVFFRWWRAWVLGLGGRQEKTGGEEAAGLTQAWMESAAFHPMR